MYLALLAPVQWSYVHNTLFIIHTQETHHFYYALHKTIACKCCCSCIRYGVKRVWNNGSSELLNAISESYWSITHLQWSYPTACQYMSPAVHYHMLKQHWWSRDNSQLVVGTLHLNEFDDRRLHDFSPWYNFDVYDWVEEYKTYEFIRCKDHVASFLYL